MRKVLLPTRLLLQIPRGRLQPRTRWACSTLLRHQHLLSHLPLKRPRRERQSLLTRLFRQAARSRALQSLQISQRLLRMASDSILQLASSLVHRLQLRPRSRTQSLEQIPMAQPRRLSFSGLTPRHHRQRHHHHHHHHRHQRRHHHLFRNLLSNQASLGLLQRAE